MLSGMKRALTIIAILTPLSAMAAAPQPLGPNKGKFGAWTAATYGTGAAKICYAFTKPQRTSPALPNRGLAMLTVTKRHASPDEVSITPGYAYPAHARVDVTVGSVKLPFFVQDNVAFTNDVKDAIAGFTREYDATAVSTGPQGQRVTDQYSLNGFSDSYKEISAACP